MKLEKLIEGLKLEIRTGKVAGEVTGLASHSKQLLFGNLFIAKRGCQENHIEEAIANGARAVVTEVYNPFVPNHIVQLVTNNIEKVEKELAARFYQMPASEMTMIGITGTSGKTTTSYLIRHLLRAQQMKVGLMGTNEYLIDQRSLPSLWTTPDLIFCQKYLREMVKSGCKAAVMEVSSHALSQDRVALIDFNIAIFTNLSQDHFDYHKDFENYFQAKALLFRTLSQKSVAILPDEGVWSERLHTMTKAKVMTYGFSENAMVRATGVRLSVDKSQFNLHYGKESIEIEIALLGRYNILNYLAAAAALLAQGFSLPQLVEPSRTFPAVAGRLERVAPEAKMAIFVDYAHKPNALENVLQELRPFTEGRLFVVFGCGGLRDQGKRPLMGAIAERYADRVVITSDNPRTEDPEKIIEGIMAGIHNKDKCLIEVDRRRAITKALEEATSKDLILIAGKGHESYQIFAHKTIDFDDRAEVITILNEMKR